MDSEYLLKAIEKAKDSVKNGGFPAGAIVVKDLQIVGEGESVGNIIHDPTAHGETAAIRNACVNLKIDSLSGATLYASMEPCVQCLGSAMWAGISKIIYACPQNKVDEAYYGGTYTSKEINGQFSKPLIIKHEESLTELSLNVVREWESH